MNIKAKGIANKSSKGDILDVFYPYIEFDGKNINNKVQNLESKYKELVKVEWTKSDLARPIEDVKEAYLKLHLLSYKLVLPNSINLEGLFNCLPNVAWTNKGPIGINEIDLKLQKSKYKNNDIFIKSVDKFPCLTDYIIPKNVRIADASRVRLGAYLSEGTTIMHEGFVNFNAGTLGKAMIVGRISAGVVIGNNSDLGGGASTMGTLSGGNELTISIGKNCLLGANAGLGISLGDNCIVEAGLYLTAGTKIELIDDTKKTQEIKKASELSGNSDLLFLRDSLTGKVIAKKNKKSINLNEELHNND